MHELSVCQGLMRQVDRIAVQNNATAVDRIVLKVGPLSGIEPELLKHAFTIARQGTVAEKAELEIQDGPVRISCTQCGTESVAAVNRLVCPLCGDWRVDVTEGEELLLLSLEIET